MHKCSHGRAMLYHNRRSPTLSHPQTDGVCGHDCTPGILQPFKSPSEHAHYFIFPFDLYAAVLLIVHPRIAISIPQRLTFRVYPTLIMSEKSTWQQNVLFGDPIGAPGMDASFDFIIVGGGTGGLTIASRLAEDPNVSVAVIEAGGEDVPS